MGDRPRLWWSARTEELVRGGEAPGVGGVPADAVELVEQPAAGTILAAWYDVARLVGREGTSPASVVDRVAVLADAHPATGGEPPRQVRAPEGVSPVVDLIERVSAARAALTATFESTSLARLGACQTCGALVPGATQLRHDLWHRGDDDE